MTDMKIAIWGDYEVAYVRELETKIERLRTLISDALDDEVALRMMSKWCEEARAALKDTKP